MHGGLPDNDDDRPKDRQSRREEQARRRQLVKSEGEHKPVGRDPSSTVLAMQNHSKVEAAKLLIKYGSPASKSDALKVLRSVMGGGSDNGAWSSEESISQAHEF